MNRRGFLKGLLGVAGAAVVGKDEAAAQIRPTVVAPTSPISLPYSWTGTSAAIVTSTVVFVDSRVMDIPST